MKMLRNALIVTLIATTISSCKSTPDARPNMDIIAQKYFALFAQRTDFKSFMSFYHENAELQDLVYGNQVKGKQAIESFFGWVENPIDFEGPVSLVVTDQAIDGLKVVTTGYFVSFTYQGQEMGPWRFVIWQDYDASGRILRQYDWINYTPKQDFVGGENLNSLVPLQ